MLRYKMLCFGRLPGLVFTNSGIVLKITGNSLGCKKKGKNKRTMELDIASGLWVDLGLDP